MPTAVIEKICSQRSDLAAYLDGELLPHEEIALETHLAVCTECRTELNEQKKLLRVLDFALEDERDFELPEDFARVVAANAESKVSGLRCSRERSKALLVCAALFLLVILGLGRETETVLESFAGFAEQFLVVGRFVVHLFYDIALGTAIILRSIGSHLLFGSTAFAVSTVIFLLSVALLGFTVCSPKLETQAQEK